MTDETHSEQEKVLCPECGSGALTVQPNTGEGVLANDTFRFQCKSCSFVFKKTLDADAVG